MSNHSDLFLQLDRDVGTLVKLAGTTTDREQADTVKRIAERTDVVMDALRKILCPESEPQ